MKSFSKDARGFVEGVMHHLTRGNKVGNMTSKMQSLLFKMSASAKHEHQAKVESAVKLTSTETQSISRVLSHILGHEVRLTRVVNPLLIGGFRVTMADWVMDSSVYNELNEMARIVTVS